MNVEATKMKEPRKILIEVPNLCKNLRDNQTIHPAMFTFSNSDSIEEAKIFYDETSEHGTSLIFKFLSFYEICFIA